MKKGDFVVCIKDNFLLVDLASWRIDSIKVFHRNGMRYEIMEMDLSNVCISCDIDDCYWYSLVGGQNFDLFSEYFITEREYRRLKLKKLGLV